MNAVLRSRVKAEDLAQAIRALHAHGGRMQMAYAWYPEPGALEVRYLGGSGPGKPFIEMAVRPEHNVLPSMACESPLLGWYEREIKDLFGLHFLDHPEPKPLIFQDSSEGVVPPMRQGDQAMDLPSVAAHSGLLPRLDGSDVQRLPWGPVRADIVESAEFIFYYIGEQILYLHPQLFFKHRGMEARFAGKTADQGTALTERISAVGGLSHALAYCQAIEAASGCEVPRRAQMLRVLLAELERLYNHLYYLGHLADTTTLKVGAAEGKYLAERAKQINGRLTGSRFLHNVLAPGGLRRDIRPEGWLGDALEALRAEVFVYTTRLDRCNSYRDRLMTTGHLPFQIAFDEGATGPVKRASGIDRDLRRDHAYAAYDGLPLTVPLRTEGDAYARARVRVEEIDASIVLIQRVLLLLAEGPVRVDCSPPPGSEGLGWAENPRGSVFYAVHFDTRSRLQRVKIKSPSFSNWRVFPFTVHDSNMMDYAINEASFGLTIAGCDR